VPARREKAVKSFAQLPKQAALDRRIVVARHR
jgi:hypothetical protein